MTTDTIAAETAQAKKVRADIALDEAVRKEATYIMKVPASRLDRVKIDKRLREAWKQYAADDTFIAFVDKVYGRLKLSYHAKNKHVAWLKSNFGLND